MCKEIFKKSFITFLEDIWEEIEIQFFGITGALLFFTFVYFFFHPPWMRSLIEFFVNLNLSK